MKIRKAGVMKVGLVAAALGLASQSTAGSIEDGLWTLMANANAELEFQGAGYRLEVIEYFTAGDEVGREVFFSDNGNKRLPYQFVPGDPRREPWSGPVGPGDDITWASDMVQGDAPGVGFAATQGAIANAMATWDGVTCSNIPLTAKAVAGNLGFLELLIFGTGSVPVADVTHAGFGSLVDLILPPPTIAATFTFVFIDGDGNETDIDNDGYPDAAFRETYYTNNYPWGDGSGDTVDVETVVLHEAGHGLSQAHFGKLFRTDKNGKFHFAPRALMNPGYTGVQRTVEKSDNAGHCSIWASWPNN